MKKFIPHVTVILAFLTPALAALKYLGKANISDFIVLAPAALLSLIVIFAWAVAIGAVLYDKFKPNTNDYR